MKTFKDLRFRPHQIPDAVIARIDFPNGHWISVVGGGRGSGARGDGKTSFEVLSSVTRSHGVRGWLSKKQVSDHMRYLKNKCC